MKVFPVAVFLTLLVFVRATADSGAPAMTAKQIVEKSQAAYDALSSYSSTGQTTSIMSGMNQTTTFSIRLQKPNLYRIDWKSGLSSGAVWSDGTGDFINLTGKPQRLESREMALASATGVSGMATATIPGTFFKLNWGGVLNSGLNWQRKPDEKIETWNCFVVSNQVTPSSGGSISSTLWIGQQDGLIYQSQTVMQGLQQPHMDLTDEQVGQALKLQGKEVTPQAIAEMRTQLMNSIKNVQKMVDAKPVSFMQEQDDIATNKTCTASDFAKP